MIPIKTRALIQHPITIVENKDINEQKRGIYIDGSACQLNNDQVIVSETLMSLANSGKITMEEAKKILEIIHKKLNEQLC